MTDDNGVEDQMARRGGKEVLFIDQRYRLSQQLLHRHGRHCCSLPFLPFLPFVDVTRLSYLTSIDENSGSHSGKCVFDKQMYCTIAISHIDMDRVDSP